MVARALILVVGRSLGRILGVSFRFPLFQPGTSLTVSATCVAQPSSAALGLWHVDKVSECANSGQSSSVACWMTLFVAILVALPDLALWDGSVLMSPSDGDQLYPCNLDG